MRNLSKFDLNSNKLNVARSLKTTTSAIDLCELRALLINLKGFDAPSVFCRQLPSINWRKQQNDHVQRPNYRANFGPPLQQTERCCIIKFWQRLEASAYSSSRPYTLPNKSNKQPTK